MAHEMTMGRIMSGLSFLGIRWSRRDDGIVVALFEDDNHSVRLGYKAEGDGTDILVVSAGLRGDIPPDDWPCALGVLNSWNSTRRWPTAALVSNAERAAIVADVQFPVPSSDDELHMLLEIATLVLCECDGFVDEHLGASTAPPICPVEDLERLWEGS